MEHKLVKKACGEGSAGSFLKAKSDASLALEYATLLHNAKASPVEITVVELLPRSIAEAIVVEVLEPASLRTDVSEAATASSEGQLKLGGVLRNKITNNVVFSRALAPQEKVEIPFKYTAKWPHTRDVEIA